MSAPELGDTSEVDIRVLRGQPDDLELAAVSAVLTAALDELAGEHRRRQGKGVSAWQRSQRAVRTPLVRGAWRTFGG
jgi:Acyl-CoA carboxylase epsilon subunit